MHSCRVSLDGKKILYCTESGRASLRDGVKVSRVEQSGLRGGREYEPDDGPDAGLRPGEVDDEDCAQRLVALEG